MSLTAATRTMEGVSHGVSPRGSLQLAALSVQKALYEGRGFVLPDDVRWAAPFALPHRLVLRTPDTVPHRPVWRVSWWNR